MIKSDELTREQIAALKKARQHFGRTWKCELRVCWHASRYPSALETVSATLQRLRNSPSFGPAGLVRYRADSVVVSSEGDK